MTQPKAPLCWMVALFCFAAITVRAGEYTFQYQKIVEIQQPMMLDLSLVAGNVTITGNSEDRVMIDAVKTVRGSNHDEAEEVADHIEIHVSSSNNTVKIETNYLKMVNRSRSFWNKLFGSSGSDSYGMVDYHISVPSQTSVTVNSMEALIVLTSLEGDINITNSSGATRGEYLFGPITISQPVGEVDLKWIEGDIRVKSTSSRIAIQQSRGAIDVATYSGSVNIQTQLDSPKNYYVETTSGSVDFTVPTYSAGVLNIETKSGEIKSDIPVAIKSVSRRRLVGEFGGGGPTISISSTTGDVEIKQF